MSKVPRITNLQYHCYISNKMERMKLAFLLADKRQRFLQIDTIILGVTRHAQITQNNKFAISLQYLEKKSE